MVSDLGNQSSVSGFRQGNGISVNASAVLVPASSSIFVAAISEGSGGRYCTLLRDALRTSRCDVGVDCFMTKQYGVSDAHCSCLSRRGVKRLQRTQQYPRSWLGD